MTTSTPMFDVKSKTGPSAVSLTSIVTVRVPSLNVPSATGSTLSSIVPAGQLGLPGCCTGVTLAAGAEVTEPTMATTSPAATASAAAAAIVTIHRPEKRDPSVLRPIPSPCALSRQSSRSLGVRGTLGGRSRSPQGPHAGAVQSAGRRTLGPLAPNVRVYCGGRPGVVHTLHPAEGGGDLSVPAPYPNTYDSAPCVRRYGNSRPRMTGGYGKRTTPPIRSWPVPARSGPSRACGYAWSRAANPGAEAASTCVTGAGAPPATA
jgi:hypothetical protein